MIQVADNATLYGVCLHTQEFVQRPPGMLGSASSLPRAPGRGSRFLITAPRCYCLLTRVPFFELHYDMLNRLVSIAFTCMKTLDVPISTHLLINGLIFVMFDL